MALTDELTAILNKLGLAAVTADVAAVVDVGAFIILKDRSNTMALGIAIAALDFHQQCRRLTENGKSLSIVVTSR